MRKIIILFLWIIPISLMAASSGISGEENPKVGSTHRYHSYWHTSNTRPHAYEVYVTNGEVLDDIQYIGEEFGTKKYVIFSEYYNQYVNVRWGNVGQGKILVKVLAMFTAPPIIYPQYEVIGKLEITVNITNYDIQVSNQTITSSKNYQTKDRIYVKNTTISGYSTVVNMTAGKAIILSPNTIIRSGTTVRLSINTALNAPAKNQQYDDEDIEFSELPYTVKEEVEPSASAVIEFTLPEEITNAAIKVYDLFGRLIKTFPVQNTSEDAYFDTSGLREGIYIYSLEADGKQISSQKIIVTK